MHLGRRPTRLPGSVREQIGASALGPGAAWRRSVDEAIALTPDAVVLAGDVVDDNDDFYEAYADLRSGVERLTQHGIQVFAVAGNHDVRVLPQLADSLADQGFRLLGRGGVWETATIERDDGDAAALAGWSFGAVQMRDNPLRDGPEEVTGMPLLGLLHCDRDQGDSPHAPVRSDELASAPVDAWLLGHIHKPDALEGPRPMGYLGSLTGLDPGEPGIHGPWLLTTGREGVSCRQLPLAPLRWETVEVALDDLADAEAVHPAITKAIDGLHERVVAADYRPRAVGCRLVLTGRTAHRRRIEQLLNADDPRESVHERDGIAYFVEAWRLDALPALSLETLAQGGDPAGLLAHKLLILRGPDCPEQRALVQEARQRLEQRLRQRPFAKLDPASPDDEETRRLLEQAAVRGLDELLAQQEAAE
jgi:predicted phosphodiesterase